MFQVSLASVVYNQDQSLNLLPGFSMYGHKVSVYPEVVVNAQSENHRSVLCFGTSSALPEFQRDFMYGSPKGQEN